MTGETPAAVPHGGDREYHLILFVAGDETNSRLARRNLDRLCEVALEGRCRIEVVDVFEDFEEALRHGVLLTPCLVVTRPTPGVHVLGNLSDAHKVRTALGLPDGERAA